MPELPEVETIKQSIAENIGARIRKLEFNRTDIIRQQDYPVESLTDLAITDVARRGKYLIINLQDGFYIVVHLGMSGRFYISDEETVDNVPHIHLIIYLDNQKKLVYQDTRRFGGIWFTREPAQIFAHMGVEPLSDEFTSAYLYQITRNRKVAIKTLLLNQNLISGIGNIYADEALFAAGVRPDRPAGSLNEKEIKRLRLVITKVLKNSINHRGTTFRDFRDGYNQVGQFQNHLKVYGKSDCPCTKCGQKIIKKRIGGRSSHYCEHCQR